MAVPIFARIIEDDTNPGHVVNVHHGGSFSASSTTWDAGARSLLSTIAPPSHQRHAEANAGLQPGPIIQHLDQYAHAPR